MTVVFSLPTPPARWRLGAACAALLLLSLYGARAQDVRGGLRVGPAFGFLNNSATPFVSKPGRAGERFNVRIDGHVGAHLVVPLAAGWAAQPELQFVRKGGHRSRAGTDMYVAERYRVSYLQAHALARRDVSLPGPLSLHAVVGLTGAVTTGARLRRTARTETETTRARVDLMDAGLVRRWDAGLLGGLGLGASVGPGVVALALRYNPSVRTVLPTAQPPLRHDVMLVAVSYTLPVWPSSGRAASTAER